MKRAELTPPTMAGTPLTEGNEVAAPGQGFKDEGNAFFKAGEHLKAAAAYTKAIKAEPNNHVYYSNRSQAFLKLSKVAKAVEDADKCISLSPDFVKGYHRKAAALHALNDAAKTDEACDVLLAAIDRGLDSNDLVRLGLQIKGKGFATQVAARRKPEDFKEEGKENGEPAKEVKKAKATAPAAPAPKAAAGGATHLYDLDPESFAGLMIKDVFTEVLEKKKVPTIAYLQPGRPQPGSTEEPGLAGVGIENAFDSPQTLTQCADFLRKHVTDHGYQSAMIVVRKGHMAFPQVWKDKKGKWPADEKKDGIIMQLEAKGARAMFFTELTKEKGAFAVGETHQIDADEFALLPRLF